MYINMNMCIYIYIYSCVYKYGYVCVSARPGSRSACVTELELAWRIEQAYGADLNLLPADGWLRPVLGGASFLLVLFIWSHHAWTKVGRTRPLWIIGGHTGRHGRGSMTLCLKSDPSKPSYMDKHCMSTEKAHGPLWRSHEHHYGKWISKKSRSHSPSIVSLPAKQLYLAVAGKPTQLPWVSPKKHIYIYILSLFLLQDNCLQRPSRTYPPTPLGRLCRSSRRSVIIAEKEHRSAADRTTREKTETISTRGPRS